MIGNTWHEEINKLRHSGTTAQCAQASTFIVAIHTAQGGAGTTLDRHAGQDTGNTLDNTLGNMLGVPLGNITCKSHVPQVVPNECTGTHSGRRFQATGRDFFSAETRPSQGYPRSARGDEPMYLGIVAAIVAQGGIVAIVA